MLLLKVERIFFFWDDSEILVPPAPMHGIVLTVLRSEDWLMLFFCCSLVGTWYDCTRDMWDCLRLDLNDSLFKFFVFLLFKVNMLSNWLNFWRISKCYTKKGTRDSPVGHNVSYLSIIFVRSIIVFEWFLHSFRMAFSIISRALSPSRMYSPVYFHLLIFFCSSFSRSRSYSLSLSLS